MIELLFSHQLGIDTGHAPGFVFELPKPAYGKNLVMCFRTGAVIRTGRGDEEIKEGDCILHTPEFPLRHGPMPDAKEGFRNDWFYIRPDGLVPAAQELKLPFNTVISTGTPNVLSSGLEELQKEIARHDAFFADAVRRIVFLMLLDVKRAADDFARFGHGGRGNSHFFALQAVRKTLLRHPEQAYDAPRLAAGCFLSPERFLALYRKFFGTTPFAELMRERNILALKLLRQSGKSVKEIAEECGWRNHRYFDRVFRKYNGVSPGEFRNRPGE